MFKKFLLALALTLSMAAPATVFAGTDPYAGLCNNGGGDSAICKTKGNSTDPVAGSNGVLVRVTNVVAFVAGAAAVFFIIFSGIKYITAQGDPSQISNAKQSMIYAAVGLVVIVLARQIISYVLSKV